MRHYTVSFLKWIIICLMCLYFGFMVGKFKQDILQNSIQLLTLDVANLRAENVALSQKLTLIQADYLVQQQVNDSLVNENKDINEALNSSHNKLYFYERVVAPGLAIAGLNIYSFSVSKDPNSEYWTYELILMQSQKGRRTLKGNIDIVFAQADDIKEAIKPLKLSEMDKTFQANFKFKYFQTLKGQFILPEDAKIDQVFVTAEADGNRWNRSQRVEKIFDWKDFIESGTSHIKELELQGGEE